jgi:hypothetical protein
MDSRKKLLIAYDGSECAEAALDDLSRAGLPLDVEAQILSVAEFWLPPPPPSAYEIVEQAREVEASEEGQGEIVVSKAPADQLPHTKIIVLDAGEIIFNGPLSEFQTCDLPAVKDLLALDQRDHSVDPYFDDPWDKSRRAQEEF